MLKMKFLLEELMKLLFLIFIPVKDWIKFGKKELIMEREENSEND